MVATQIVRLGVTPNCTDKVDSRDTGVVAAVINVLPGTRCCAGCKLAAGLFGWMLPRFGCTATSTTRRVRLHKRRISAISGRLGAAQTPNNGNFRAVKQPCIKKPWCVASKIGLLTISLNLLTFVTVFDNVCSVFIFCQ